MCAAQGSETLGDLGGPHGGYRALLYAFAAMHWAVLLSGCAAAPHLHPLVLMGAHCAPGWGVLLSQRLLEQHYCVLRLRQAEFNVKE